MTHISDYMRVALLEKYGGIYVDCNFYVTRPLDFVGDRPFYTIKHGLYSDWHVCKGLWTTGFMASGANNVFFSYLKFMYDSYFALYGFVPSYFFIDALIAVGYEDIPQIKQQIDAVPLNNTDYNFMNVHGNEVFEEKTWQAVSLRTFLFNISYKNKFIESINGKETYYHHIHSEKH